jgi:DNA-binding transcriptional regulator YhcF (GntR family)
MTLVQEMAGLDEGAPLFAQVAERLAAEIADGGLAEGERVPSSNELAAYYRINPATAAKGIGVLTDDGLVEKHRGIGMFVPPGRGNGCWNDAARSSRNALSSRWWPRRPGLASIARSSPT